MSHIFLSYAHPDTETARALYERISAAGYPVWFDKVSLMVGQRWEDEISRAIQESLGFVALISENSVDRRGYVQKELRLALDELANTPANQVYLFPIRISNVSPQEPQLRAIQWLDYFEDEDGSVQKLLKAFSSIPGLVGLTDEKKRAEERASDPPRFESMADVFHAILERIPSATPPSWAINAFYITVETDRTDIEIPEELRQRYRKEITFVLEHQYQDLVCHQESFSVTLWFSGEPTRITIPYNAITQITEPNADIRIA